MEFKAKDEEKEIARCFFTPADFEEMGSSVDIILEKVAKDPTIRRNLQKHRTRNEFDEKLEKFELKSELTEEQIMTRNQMIRDRIRAQ